MNRLSKFLMLLALVVCCSCSKTEDNTKKIYNVGDLVDFRNSVNDGNYNLNGELMANIDLSNIEWEPIGITAAIPYSATFDGNGHTISNLTFSNAASNQGLFGVVYEASISNLKIDNPQLSAGSNIGALCGYVVENCMITNCSVNGGEVSGYSSVGGLVGKAYDTIITDCFNTSEVTSGAHHAGGVVGSASASKIRGCYNSGDVSTSDDYVGGVVGYPYDSQLSGCYNSGNITTDGNHVGGIAGYSIGYVLACYNTGTISGGNYVGGVVGSSMTPYSSYLESPEIVACYNSGAVSGTQFYAAIVGRALTTTNIEICYFVDATSALAGAWIEDGSGTFTSSDEGMEVMTSTSALNAEVEDINEAIEHYIFSSGKVDIAYRYKAGEPTNSVTPQLYKY